MAVECQFLSLVFNIKRCFVIELFRFKNVPVFFGSPRLLIYRKHNLNIKKIIGKLFGFKIEHHSKSNNYLI